MLNKKALAATAGGAEPLYVEDVFSTYLYTGNGSTQTITTGIDLAGKGGMLWIKNRSGVTNNIVNDTARGAGYNLMTNSTSAQFLNTDNVSAISSTGFSVGVDSNTNGTTGNLYASWTFRKAEKFFDVVTYTGNGSDRTIAHNLGSTPGCIIVKRTDTTGTWRVYHRSVGAGNYLVLNTTAASTAGSATWNDTAPTSTVFSLGTTSDVNANGGTYVAYLFAHDAGGFGDSGSESVIKCGSYSGNAGSQTIDLGWEPQFLLIKRATGGTGNWYIMDNMRGLFTSGAKANYLRPNTTAIEANDPNIYAYATGFGLNSEGSAEYNASGSTYIYIAIRRGPMKTPEVGTEVFSPVLGNGSGTIPNFQSNFVTDAGWMKTKNNTSNIFAGSRLQGAVTLFTNLTDAEAASTGMTWDSNSGWGSFGRDSNNIGWSFRRAPGFFDVVCWTSSNAGFNFGENQRITHNLGATPELIFHKIRNTTGVWFVYQASQGRNKYAMLQSTNAFTSYTDIFGTADPTTTDFGMNCGATYGTGNNIVSYLFATVTGVSKVGSYTGTGATLQVNCGFTGGARFVMIKRADSTGDWYVWDSSRGIVAGNDPYLLLNSTAAEVTNTDYIDTYSQGFEISSTAPAAINANGGTFIYLAIA